MAFTVGYSAHSIFSYFPFAVVTDVLQAAGRNPQVTWSVEPKGYSDPATRVRNQECSKQRNVLIPPIVQPTECNPEKCLQKPLQFILF